MATLVRVFETIYDQRGVQGQKSRTLPRASYYRSRQEPVPETTEKRPARHEDTMLLAGLFRTLEQKDLIKLGWFSYAFAEITDVMNTEMDFRRIGIQFQITIYTMQQEKQAIFCFF